MNRIISLSATCAASFFSQVGFPTKNLFGNSSVGESSCMFSCTLWFEMTLLPVHLLCTGSHYWKVQELTSLTLIPYVHGVRFTLQYSFAWSLFHEGWMFMDE